LLHDRDTTEAEDHEGEYQAQGNMIAIRGTNRVNEAAMPRIKLGRE